MMTVDHAKQFAEDHFPDGPEALAKKLGIKVVMGPLVGCDGWVLSGPAGTLIRINEESGLKRRRFTLAHELAHLILGIPTVVGESISDSLRSNDSEERKVNDLASELLVPKSVVCQHCPQVPVIASQLRKLAKDANVSELAAATRVANLAVEVGLVNASVTFFKDDELEWNWSKTLTLPEDLAKALLNESRKSHPKPFRYPRKKTNDVIVASLIEYFDGSSSTLFVQLLPAEAVKQLSPAERRIALESDLFSDDVTFRPVIQGCFSAMKKRCQGMTIRQAISDFNSRYADKWTPSQKMKVASSNGQEYVRLRLSEWCQ